MEQFAYCSVAVAPVRAESSDKSEIVTQLLFGELITILERNKQWIKVQSFSDNYEGWMDGKQARPLTKKEMTRWQNGLATENALYRKLLTPWGEQLIPRGSFVPSPNAGSFNIGNDTFEFLDEASEGPADIVHYAKEYLNTPYLWGGKTPFGIDCSGLTQMVFRQFDYNLPRDASQQVDLGNETEFEERQAGDLAFFVNQQERVHHVGILISENEIIHASGQVRIDELTRSGILNRDNEELTHRLFCIKRL